MVVTSMNWKRPFWVTDRIFALLNHWLIFRIYAGLNNSMTDWLIVDWLTGGPVDVTVGFWVLSIDTINVIDMVSNET